MKNRSARTPLDSFNDQRWERYRHGFLLQPPVARLRRRLRSAAQRVGDGETQPKSGFQAYRSVTLRQAEDASVAIRDTVDAFSEWIEPHLGDMARLAARLSSEAERDDVVQDAVIQAWRKRHQYTPARGPLRTWLLAITADRARRARRNRRSDLPLADYPGRVRSLDGRIDLAAAVKGLPPRQRLALDCFYFVGLSVAETAAVMRCSEGTVKSTLADARKRLRAVLEDDDGRADR